MQKSQPFDGYLYDGLSATPQGVVVLFNPSSGAISILSKDGSERVIERRNYSVQLFRGTPVVRLYLVEGCTVDLSFSSALQETLLPHLSVGHRVVYWFESGRPRAFFSLFLAAAFAGAFFVYVPDYIIPMLKPLVSHRTQSIIAEQTMKVLDSSLLDETALGGDAQKHAIRVVQRLQTKALPNQTLNVMFRRVPKAPSMMNAFALIPDNVVLFDALVLGLTEDELEAVVLHEIGHLRYEHGLDALIRASFLSLVSIVILGGDPGTLHAVAISLLDARHSQAAEIEADLFAAKLLAELGKDPLVLATALDKLESAQGASNREDDSILKYLSSHPLTSERRKLLVDFKSQQVAISPR